MPGYLYGPKRQNQHTHTSVPSLHSPTPLPTKGGVFESSPDLWQQKVLAHGFIHRYNTWARVCPCDLQKLGVGGNWEEIARTLTEPIVYFSLLAGMPLFLSNPSSYHICLGSIYKFFKTHLSMKTFLKAVALLNGVSTPGRVDFTPLYDLSLYTVHISIKARSYVFPY